MKITKLIRFDFLPYSTDFGLLVLRTWFGLTMLLVHGLDKVKNFGGMVENFSKGGIPPVLAAAAILAESVGAALVVIGFATRWAALSLIATMGVAFFHAHKAVLDPMAPPPGSGEMAFLYLAAFVTIFIAGAGRWSVDAKLRA
jgi:putative oxidoreductase